MQGFVEGQVQMHRPAGLAPAIAAGRRHRLGGQLLEPLARERRQPLRRSLKQPPAAGQQEAFLGHGLIGAAGLQVLRPVGAQQQQRDGAQIGLHGGGQQLGHGRAGGGDHGGGSAQTAAQAQREEGGRAFIDGRVQTQAPALQQGGGHRQGGRAAAGAEHQMLQSSPLQGGQQGQGRQAVGTGAGGRIRGGAIRSGSHGAARLHRMERSSQAAPAPCAGPLSDPHEPSASEPWVSHRAPPGRRARSMTPAHPGPGGAVITDPGRTSATPRAMAMGPLKWASSG